MIHPGDHIENPLGAKLKKRDFQFGIAIKHPVTDDRHEGELRRQRHADDVAVVDRPSEFRKRRIAHAQVRANSSHTVTKLGSESMRSPAVPKTTAARAPSCRISSSAANASL